MKDKEITFAEILNHVEANFRSIDQWAGMQSFERAYYYQGQTEALIGIMEIKICGSYGGFDKGQRDWIGTVYVDNPHDHVSLDLYKRYLWIKERYR